MLEFYAGFLTGCFSSLIFLTGCICVLCYKYERWSTEVNQEDFKGEK